MYRRSRLRRKRIIKFIIFLAVLLFAGFFVYAFLLKPKEKIATKNEAVIPLQSTTTPSPTAIPLPDNSPGLTTTIQDALSGTHGSYGIVVKNLKTGESYYQNAKTSYQSGSLYKLWNMAVVYQEIQQGKLHEQDTLSKDVGALYDEFHVLPDGTEQSSGTLSMTVSDALYQMITISSNNAALLITDKIGVPAIEGFLERNDFHDSKVGGDNEPPTTTPYDTALFFEKLYNDQLANKDISDKMLNLLTQQRLNDKLPKYLPFGVVVAHKTGELDDVTHDAGIVYDEDTGDYIIVVLSQSDNPDQAKERIALVSQAVYNYFTNTSTPTPSQ